MINAKASLTKTWETSTSVSNMKHCIVRFPKKRHTYHQRKCGREDEQSNRANRPQKQRPLPQPVQTTLTLYQVARTTTTTTTTKEEE